MIQLPLPIGCNSPPSHSLVSGGVTGGHTMITGDPHEPCQGTQPDPIFRREMRVTVRVMWES
jgi:hypothetical protein